MTTPSPGPSWPPGPPPAPSGGNKTLWIVLGVVGGILVLCCGGGGLLFLLIAASSDTTGDGAGGDDIPAVSSEEPLEIESGEVFRAADFEVEPGWSIKEHEDEHEILESTEIVDLEVTNTGDSADYFNVTFTFTKQGQEVGEIDCGSDGQVQPGNSEKIACMAADLARVPADWDRVTVSPSYG